MATEQTQFHLLANGETVEIKRIDGRGHKYVVDGGAPMPSVTGLIGHVESDGFGVGSGWATKMIRLAAGDLNAPKNATDAAIALGNEVHEAIENYIEKSVVDEASLPFISWLNTVGNLHSWVAGEAFLYHPDMHYGGTLDAISGGDDGILWDWKTKDPVSYYGEIQDGKKVGGYGGSLKDHAQVASYVMALDAMGSQWKPKKARIAYIMRDGSGTDVVDVDLDAGMALFLTSRKMKLLADEYKDMAKPGTQQEGN